jgi:hypothetical protein
MQAPNWAGSLGRISVLKSTTGAFNHSDFVARHNSRSCFNAASINATNYPPGTAAKSFSGIVNRFLDLLKKDWASYCIYSSFTPTMAVSGLHRSGIPRPNYG